MLYDTLDNLAACGALPPRLALALRFLAETDFSRLPDGRVELEGQDVFASLSTYETRAANETPEAHRRYIDVQYLISGRERVGVAPLADMEAEVSGDARKDIWFYRGPAEQLTLGGNRVMVFFPQDAHAPCIACGPADTVRKCVVKVRV